MTMLADDMLDRVLPAKIVSFPSPGPTPIRSRDEYQPTLQFLRRREVEVRPVEMGDRLGNERVLSHRRLFQTASSSRSVRRDDRADGGERGNLRCGFVSRPA